MTAYSIDGDGPTYLDGEQKYQLPFVRCSSCRQTWGDGRYSLPAFDYEFYAEETLSDTERIVSLGELDRLRARILERVGREVWLPPGASLGPFYGLSVTTRLRDFEMCGPYGPLISLDALEVMSNDGVRVLTGRAVLRCHGKRIDTHAALHIESAPRPLLAPRTVDLLTLQHCLSCDGYSPRDPRATMKMGEYELMKQFVPAGAPIFRLREWSARIVSEAFMDCVKRRGLKGIRFREFGRYV